MSYLGQFAAENLFIELGRLLLPTTVKISVTMATHSFPVSSNLISMF